MLLVVVIAAPVGARVLLFEVAVALALAVLRKVPLVVGGQLGLLHLVPLVLLLELGLFALVVLLLVALCLLVSIEVPSVLLGALVLALLLVVHSLVTLVVAHTPPAPLIAIVG